MKMEMKNAWPDPHFQYTIEGPHGCYVSMIVISMSRVKHCRAGDPYIMVVEDILFDGFNSTE